MAPKSNPKDQKVLLVGWHAAGWDVITPLLDRGELPNLARVLEQGVMGSMTSVRPVMEPMVYSSLATGKYPEKHGIFGTHEMGSYGQSFRPITSLSRRAKAFWEILSQNDVLCNVVNFPTAEPAEETSGSFVGRAFFGSQRTSSWSPVHVPEDSVWPADLASTLQEFIVALEDLDPPTVGLFVPRMSELSFRDDRLAQIASAVTQTLSVHAVATWLMENSQWRVMSVNYPAIEVFSRKFLQYHPPRLDWVDPEEFDLFKDVVNSSVRLCDLLLGRVLALAGEDAAVIIYSPRAYQAHHRVSQTPVSGPRTEAQLHRPQGIFVMRADGTRRDELIHGVRETDFCPTVLALCNVAVPEDMDGRVLTDAFAQPLPQAKTIKTWETRPPVRPALPEDRQPIPWTEQMSFTSAHGGRNALWVQMQNDWNQAEACLNSSRPDLALPLMTRLYYVTPFWTEMAPLVAESLYLHGLTEEAITVMRNFVSVHGQSPAGKCMAGVIAQSEGRDYEALDLFEDAAKDNPPIPQLYLYLGEVHRRAHRLGRAMDCFTQAIEIDSTCIPGYLGRSRVRLASGEHEAAADEALQALSVDFSSAPAHYMLGMCLEKLDDPEQAKQAYANALRFNENFTLAKNRLAHLQSGGELEDVEEEDALPLAGEGPSRWDVDQLRLGVAGARREVSIWANNFIDCFRQADQQLDAYLATNASQLADQDDQAPPAESSEISGPMLTDMGLVVRPIMPADFGQVSEITSRVLTEHHRHDVFVLHREGEIPLIGAVSLRTGDNTGKRIALVPYLASLAAAADVGLDENTARWALIRAGIIRAVASGATAVSYAFSPEGQGQLRESLERVGFRVKKREMVFGMDMAATRDRCLRVVERCRQRQVIPDDVRVVSFRDVPMHKVDQFFQGFFDDGVGPGRLGLDERLSLVILRGDEIIAGYVGHVQDDIWISPRLAVLDEYQNGWATPMLVGYGAKAGYDSGLRTIHLYADESVFPDMIRIGRRTGGKELARTWIMTLDIVVPWSQPGQKKP
ncbi:hypothetical protein LCGC14_0525250 [marine sediment metagenome]|uniref:Uncharacterized protein n=1 Tax=marine sediment metagenome TaxID=412755 RepID=A0A0F9UIP4_9ZZZZ